MEDIHKLLWGESIDGVNMQSILEHLGYNQEVSQLLSNMAFAFKREEIAEARAEIDTWLLRQAMEYFIDMSRGKNGQNE